MSSRIEHGRAELLAWERGKPTSYFDTDPNIQAVLRMHLGEQAQAHWERLEHVGQVSATLMDALACNASRDENLPVLRRWSDVGERIEEIVFHPAYHELGELFWRSGVLGVLSEPGHDVLAGALAYLLDHHGEAGHACPVACTAGAIKLLRAVGTEDQQLRYLPGLCETDYGKRIHASQFVTEVQGGSDVGSNDCLAEPARDRPGMFRISGEKWFCSVADAGLFVLTARVQGQGDGTRGLGLFLVPRRLEGRPNGFFLRRLKVKLGTRSLASAEIDFEHAIAEPLGRLDQGFKNLIGIVLDTSRVHNALAACGLMRRACIEAWTFAQHRRAFGRPIGTYPMVQQTLARMKVQTAAAMATTFRILALSDRIAGAAGSAELVAARRTLVNINKYWTSLACTETVRNGIEILGGNGTIEEFSVMPRLYRDAMVIESWEGTHNTLCAQVLRDFAQRELHRPWLAELRDALGGVREPSSAEHRERASALLGDVTARLERLLGGDDAFAARHVRHVVDRMCVLHAYVSLLLERDWEARHGAPTGKATLVELYQRLFVEPRDPMADDTLGTLQLELSRSP
jgi:acyl-CoA dehydrogenase